MKRLLPWLVVLGGLTALSAIVFRELKSHDGDTVSLHKDLQPAV